MRSIVRVRYTWLLGVALCYGGPRDAPADPPDTLPQDSFFTSLKQALKENTDREVVRGHFDLGSAPNVHRYYCLVDPKTGAREPNAVLGDTSPRADGMTGIKNSSVSMYRCANAEQRGMLVTEGYVVSGPAGAQAAPPSSPARALPAPPAVSPQVTPSQDAVRLQPDQIDVAGVKLGMSPDEVRAVLKSKKLADYRESAETLSYWDSAKQVMQPLPNGRFVNVIAAWTASSAATAGEDFQADGESYEVMFTPVPGQERVMGIVHTVGYSPPNAPHETVLEGGLVKKYGSLGGSGDLPQSPTWRFQSSGGALAGDACNGRGVYAGLGALNVAKVRENVALKKTPEDFQSQIDHCGAAIVSEDHFTANGGALRDDRLVTRFTVAAYSPSIGLTGAGAASRLIEAAGGTIKKLGAPRAGDQTAPSL
jgi:hypothetical protein